MLGSSLLMIFIIAVLVGIVSGLWGLLLDFLLDFGHLLGSIRRRIAEKILIKATDGVLLDDLTKVQDTTGLPWGYKINYMAECYDKVAGKYPRFRIWNCPYCISLRIAALSIPFTVFMSEVFLDFSTEELVLSGILSLIVIPAICFLTVKLLN